MLLSPYRFAADGGGGGAAHSRWRILITAGMHPSYISVAELEIRATSGGANQCSGGSPSASGQYDSTYSAEKAFDGVASTMWAKPGVSGSWLAYQFAAPVECTQIAIKSDNWSFGGNVAPLSFTVQYSDDGVAWTNWWSVVNSQSLTSGEVRVFTKP